MPDFFESQHSVLKRFFLAITSILICLALPAKANDDIVQRYPSGWIKAIERPIAAPINEVGAIKHFMTEFYTALGPDFEWKELQEISDGTHHHHTYRLFYRGRLVLDQFLKVHYNWKGWIEYATSTLQKSFVLDFPQQEKRTFQIFSNRVLESDPSAKFRSNAVVWIDPESGNAFPALDVLIFSKNSPAPRHLIIEEGSGKVLSEKQTVRNATAAAKVYKISPFNSRSPENVTLENLTNTTSLQSSFVRVRREQPDTTVDPTGVTTTDITPMDFTGVSGFSASPGSFDYTCEATSGTISEKCPNQGFDGVNVYYHIDNFRRRVNTYLSTLAATVSFTYDPLNVLINPLSITTSSNNAMYVGEPCRSDGTMDRCLVFLRPDTLSGASAQKNCGVSSAQFYDLAREAVVLAHEYQHYVTDMITHIGFTTSGATFGDALHEGYSDYLAASYATEHNGTDVTIVGEYALQECAPLKRDLATVRVFENSDADKDPHASGLSFASGLWKLRQELGVTVADLIAVKSLFYLSTNPGALEAVEALVKADKAVYSGSHVARIRGLFYDEIKFIGGQSGVFRNSSDLTAEVGLKGCASVGLPGSTSGFPSLAAFLAWLSMSVSIGRVYKNRKRDTR